MVLLAAIALGVICLFQLVTLPVEFDASRRAKMLLVNLGIVGNEEMKGVHETLGAAALTYVAAFVASLGSLLHILLLLSGSRPTTEPCANFQRGKLVRPDQLFCGLSSG